MTVDTPRPRLVILGLDGVCWSMLQTLSAAGVTPRLKEIMERSACGPMLSTLPEISPVAWTTFFTGRSPGEHGIYGFNDFEWGGYGQYFNSSADVKVPCIWDWLGLRGGRSVVLNVPLTYPARPLAGVMVSGFVALDYERAAYPQWVSGYLRENGYRLEADFERVHQDRPGFLADLDKALAGRARLLERFWKDDWDLFTLVVTDTDRLHHFFFREYQEGGPITEYFLDFYRRVDELVGRVHDLTADLAASSESGAVLVMLSDHGFTGVRQEFHLNRWLAAHGFQDRPGPEARVLALDPTRLYFNRPPRFPGGRAGADDWSLIGRLTAELLTEPAVSGVRLGRETFSGPAAGLAPDLVVEPAPGFEFKAKFTPGDIYTSSPLLGTHTRSDAFFLVRDFTERLPAPGPKDILDFGRYVFSLLGL